MAIRCQACNEAPATIHLTDIKADGETVERHLCEPCADNEGVTMKPHEPINLMLEKFVKIGAGMQEAAKRTCPSCGISFGEFRANGLLGCAQDYEVFGDLLNPLIERAHEGADQHRGKQPGEATDQSKARARVMQIKRELEDAVKSEAYEDAARLRDELSKLEVDG